jgi:hypothetical protein
MYRNNYDIVVRDTKTKKENILCKIFGHSVTKDPVSFAKQTNVFFIKHDFSISFFCATTLCHRCRRRFSIEKVHGFSFVNEKHLYDGDYDGDVTENHSETPKHNFTIPFNFVFNHFIDYLFFSASTPKIIKGHRIKTENIELICSLKQYNNLVANNRIKPEKPSFFQNWEFVCLDSSEKVFVNRKACLIEPYNIDLDPFS